MYIYTQWNRFVERGEIEHFEYEAQLYMYILYCRIKTPNFYIKINYNNFRASLVYKVHQLFHYHHNEKQRRFFILIICFSNCNAHIIQLTRIVANNLHVLRYTQERFFVRFSLIILAFSAFAVVVSIVLFGPVAVFHGRHLNLSIYRDEGKHMNTVV